MSQADAGPDAASPDVFPPDAEVSERLEEYDETRLPLALKQAADAAALHDGETPGDPASADALARQRVAGWLAILERVKRDLDPAFDPAKPPPRRVTPPPTASGAQLPPGALPDDLKDPAARQAYVAAMQQNADRITSFARDLKLHQAHAVVLERAPQSVADAHTSLGLPVEEIEAMIERADIQAADRDALTAGLR